MKGIRVLGLAAAAAIMMGLCGCSSKTMLKNREGDRLKPDEIEVGDIVRMGDYHGADKWIVLDIDDGQALLISKNVVDVVEFDKSSNKWEKSEIREWLNGEYLEETFDDDEQKALADEDGDRVFLLSEEQVKDLVDSSDRKSEPTDYAIKNGVNKSNGYSTWWTSTASTTSKPKVRCYSSTGSTTSKTPDDQSIGVRPAILVEIGE